MTISMERGTFVGTNVERTSNEYNSAFVNSEYAPRLVQFADLFRNTSVTRLFTGAFPQGFPQKLWKHAACGQRESDLTE